MSERKGRRRTSNARSRVRKVAQKAGFRSAFEQRVADNLTALDIEFEYEPKDAELEYILEPKVYHPDFRLPNGILVETKGRLTVEDRVKLVKVRDQHPEVDLRLVFMYPLNKLTSRSKTRYWEWAEKNGFKWADSFVPRSWVDE